MAYFTDFGCRDFATQAGTCLGTGDKALLGVISSIGSENGQNRPSAQIMIMPCFLLAIFNGSRMMHMASWNKLEQYSALVSLVSFSFKVGR